MGFGVDGKCGTRWCTGCGVCCAAARARAFLGGIHRRQRLGILEQLIEKESSVWRLKNFIHAVAPGACSWATARLVGPANPGGSPIPPRRPHSHGHFFPRIPSGATVPCFVENRCCDRSPTQKRSDVPAPLFLTASPRRGAATLGHHSSPLVSSG